MLPYFCASTDGVYCARHVGVEIQCELINLLVQAHRRVESALPLSALLSFLMSASLPSVSGTRDTASQPMAPVHAFVPELQASVDSALRSLSLGRNRETQCRTVRYTYCFARAGDNLLYLMLPTMRQAASGAHSPVHFRSLLHLLHACWQECGPARPLQEESIAVCSELAA